LEKNKSYCNKKERVKHNIDHQHDINGSQRATSIANVTPAVVITIAEIVLVCSCSVDCWCYCTNGTWHPGWATSTSEL